MSKAICSNHTLSGNVSVPGSKSHTIRALLLAMLADGTSRIANPLPSNDCISAAQAVRSFGGKVDMGCDCDEAGKPLGTPANVWTVTGRGASIELPSAPVDVGNSGSTLYFFAPVAATLAGTTTFTGDASICKRPVSHLLDALRQMGASADTTRAGVDAPPFTVTGPVKAAGIVTDGRLSQYISGIMMASPLIAGDIDIELTDPKETPYLTMTQQWLASAGVTVDVSPDYRHIHAHGPCTVNPKDSRVPADWEAVAFPLVGALVSGSDITITGVDASHSQGDEAVVDILRSWGADIQLAAEAGSVTGDLVVRGSRSRRLAVPGGMTRINISGFPDAVCALAVAACFAEGTVVLDDTGVCRRKETDRIKVLESELGKLGADVTDGLSLPETDPLHGDCLIIRGHSPLAADGTANAAFVLHGGEVESYDDHRIAMSLACLGLGLPVAADGTAGQVIVNDAECCSVSFPGFFDVMNGIGAGFTGV